MQKKQIVIMACEYVFECGAVVIALTFDGIFSNLTCAKLLGCEFNDFKNIKTTFLVEKFNTEVCAFLDPVHVLKLMRNLFDHFKVFYDADNNRIDYNYVVKLVELQESEGLHLGNKLTKSHVFFRSRIMNVKLAAQLLSDSVADGLDFCLNELKLPEFNGCEGTIKFIRYCNKIFDILNSRVIVNKNPFKRPLSRSNYERITEFSTGAIHYIEGKFHFNLHATNSYWKTFENPLSITIPYTFNIDWLAES